MKIALLGGSFNPPHLGHRALVEKLLREESFEEIWIIPTYQHAFGKKLESFEQRLEMCRLNFSNLSPKIKIQSFEKDINNVEGYSIHLIHFITNHFPQDDFFLVMGSDLILEKHKWKNFEEIEKRVSLYPICRAGYEESDLPCISSTEVRQKVKNKENLNDVLYSFVAQFIREQKLYE